MKLLNEKSFEQRVSSEEIKLVESLERLDDLNKEIETEMKAVALEMERLEMKQLHLASLKSNNNGTIKVLQELVGYGKTEEQ